MPHGSSASDFALMALSYRLRDRLKPRRPYLEEAGVRVGMTVLDFGCGPGSYTEVAARMVGPSGRVYALDRNPAAIQATQSRVARAGLRNVKTIQSDGTTGLLRRSVDLILLYDIFHDLQHPDDVLGELHHVLRPSGVLSAQDHHLKGTLLTQAIESSGLFRRTLVGALTLTFAPVGKGT